MTDVVTERDRIVDDARRGDIERLPRMPPHPLAIIQMALAGGMDPDKLTRLYDLAERYKADQAREAYGVAMALAQGEMPAVLKDAANSDTKARYATLEAVNSAVKPVYSKHGFSVTFNTEKSILEGHLRISAKITHAGGHAETVTGDFPLDGVGPKGGKLAMTPIQATGSTYSYARRYLLMLAFNISAANEDNDGNARDAVIDIEQIGEINGLLDECAQVGKPITLSRFLEWLGVTELDQLPMSKFAVAIRELNRRRRSAK